MTYPYLHIPWFTLILSFVNGVCLCYLAQGLHHSTTLCLASLTFIIRFSLLRHCIGSIDNRLGVFLITSFTNNELGSILYKTYIDTKVDGR